MGAKQTKRQFFVQQSGSCKSRLAELRGRTDDLVHIAQPQFASASIAAMLTGVVDESGLITGGTLHAARFVSA